ncbi:glutamine amidotransferase [Enterovirga sp.]|uniref:glutamine amidotransferase n=1 Tax=Enterovirga sp. TaxID=2026350 RepID=UPI002C9DBB36|nr:glutamine amidotransferase [Enterovirga sp.]HMO29234.1 glutamine amidotransferase [Enterovirga sp.]
MVLHQETSSPGRLGRLLMERGHALDLRRPCLGDPLPETLARHAGAVVFGGPMSANDDLDFVRREIDWIGVALKERKPYLGLCLGAQMLARHLGARVYPHAGGRAEIGYYPLIPTEAGLRFSSELGASWPGHVYHWHREGFDRPAGATMLATGDDFPTQAIQVGPSAFGLQFHPEVTHAMMCRWTVRGAERLSMPGAQDRTRQIEGRFMHDPAVRLWLTAFLDHWLGASAPSTAPRAVSLPRYAGEDQGAASGPPP